MNFVKHLVRFAFCAASDYDVEDLKKLLRVIIPSLASGACLLCPRLIQLTQL